ncbi:hypothetical protein BC834DRAFT_846342 [Gloeopeniophorella convolvens]|nr:hypothetical protein BC834DRAFT_846342 [Gloeopeniophorella convolvens]
MVAGTRAGVFDHKGVVGTFRACTRSSLVMGYSDDDFSTDKSKHMKDEAYASRPRRRAAQTTRSMIQNFYQEGGMLDSQTTDSQIFPELAAEHGLGSENTEFQDIAEEPTIEDLQNEIHELEKELVKTRYALAHEAKMAEFFKTQWTLSHEFVVQLSVEAERNEGASGPGEAAEGVGERRESKAGESWNIPSQPEIGSPQYQNELVIKFLLEEWGKVEHANVVHECDVKRLQAQLKEAKSAGTQCSPQRPRDSKSPQKRHVSSDGSESVGDLDTTLVAKSPKKLKVIYVG